MIILASRVRRGPRTLALGSLAHQVVHHAHQPVLVIPAPRSHARGPPHTGPRAWTGGGRRRPAREKGDEGTPSNDA